ncbi:hypothetical protein DWB85_07565 [Seongchinamella sediminis]|uniref:Phosphate-selective porin O and P n=1 Tax=Seongchinamella sediminis TaxID=2283635 RepID=A0A3L7E0L5_9GAMM|nr:hypothetical protein [Seongchinamella sediminis]RLQ22469.1 hypothetical protein DWB85_07565 [Seongchinamella sediminis]
MAPASLSLLLLFPLLAAPAIAANHNVEELEARVARLTAELAAANAALAEARNSATDAEQRLATLEQQHSDITIGPLTVGGAVRVNYVHGDYTLNGDAPQRGGNGGNMELDTFRINMGLRHEQVIGKLEYRWYNGYNFLHTGWLGYEFDDGSQVQAGLTRVPFGPGPYGVSQSWFFDLHYYVGLADDMDVGVKYLFQRGNWDLALAYFNSSERNWNGASRDSARYSYDIVQWESAIEDDGTVTSAPGNGYDERNQLNLRAIYRWQSDAVPTELGLSLQAGELRGKRTDDGDHIAAAVHMKNSIGNLTLASQLSRYEIDIDADNRLGTDELVPMGAYDFAWPVATEAWLPAVSLSYRYNTDALPWLDYVLPYAEYSGILKDSDLLNDSEMITLGAAWASGGWYIYTDYVWSNGNLFIGNEGDDYTNIYNGVGDFGANGNDAWNYRLNINFGYYF